MQAGSSFQEMMQRYNREIARMYERSRQGPAPQAEYFAEESSILEPPAAESPVTEPAAAEKPAGAGDAGISSDSAGTALVVAKTSPAGMPAEDMTLSEALSVLMRYRTLDKAGRLSLAQSLAVELAQIALEMCSGVIDLLCREDPELDEEGT